jgi:hypothetical protein
MSIGALSAANQQMGLILQLLQATQTAQVEMAEKVIATDAAQQMDVQRMEIAGQIIDTYA